MVLWLRVPGSFDVRMGREVIHREPRRHGRLHLLERLGSRCTQQRPPVNHDARHKHLHK